MYHDIIESLVTALEVKDDYTGGHSRRVADMTFRLCSVLGIKGKDMDDIHIAAHLHDIGKIGVPDKILNKPGKLLPHEWEYIKQHPVIGYNILNKSKKLNKIAKLVLYHHESWNGKGYPEGLKLTEIPLGARIIAVCDTIDAMTSKRPCREAIDEEICKKEIENNSGIMFDPVIAQCVINNWSKIIQL